jgi:hypothetical protein
MDMQGGWSVMGGQRFSGGWERVLDGAGAVRWQLRVAFGGVKGFFASLGVVLYTSDVYLAAE